MADNKPDDNDPPKSESKLTSTFSSLGASLTSLVNKVKAEAADPANREKLSGFIKGMSEKIQNQTKMTKDVILKKMQKNKAENEATKEEPPEKKE